MRQMIWAAVLLGSAGAAQAQDCAAIENDVARLSCNDDMAELSQNEVGAPIPWTITNDINPLTLVPRQRISIVASQTLECSHRPAELAISCDEKGLSLAILPKCSEFLFVSERPTTYRTRFGDTGVGVSGFSNIYRGELSATSAEHAQRLIDRMMSHREFVIEIPLDDDQRPLILSFETIGLNAALEAAQMQCGVLAEIE